MNSTLIETISKRKSNLKNFNPTPEHIAIIMDGNRRWAKNRGLPVMLGHWKGADALIQIIRAAIQVGVKILTIYSFSTENWKRSNWEVEALMRLLKSYLIQQRTLMIQEGVRLQTIGNLSKLPDDVRNILDETIELTKKEDCLDLVIALNYGGRDEIRRAIHNIVDDFQRGKISKEDISEKKISTYLDTTRWKDPDLLIRTGGANRISNFLLWQISYCEIFVSDVLWPDFKGKDLIHAIEDYKKRNQKLGR